MKIGSEIGPYKMGNSFEYEAGQEKVEKIINESKEKDAVKKNAWALQDGVSPERPHIWWPPWGRARSYGHEPSSQSFLGIIWGIIWAAVDHAHKVS